MKLEEVKALSDNELRIKVAELLGWSDVENDRIVLNVHELRGMAPDQTYLSYGRWRIKVPNYPRDLNACHKMENSRIMNDTRRFVLYCANLTDIVDGQNPGKLHTHKSAMLYEPPPRILNATARQRCEAFVLTMGEV